MRYSLQSLLVVLLIATCHAEPVPVPPIAGEGVVVHVGCGDGSNTLQLRVSDTCLLQGLDTDPAAVEQARAEIRAQGLYGRVSAIEWDGANLPYVDNFVNLLVVDDAAELTDLEIARVLAPNGVASLRDGNWRFVRGLNSAGFSLSSEDDYVRCRKPRPSEIDDWTHYLHSANNNAVARDSVVAPPRSMQWVGGPRYSRHHDKMSSVSAVVSAAGRVFTIVDEAPPVSILTPPQWNLVARDAFNGVVLWRRPIGTWHSHMHGLKSGPADLPRKLVAVGDRVYVTLDLYGPVQALDAATGKTVRTFENTGGSEEILVADGSLYVQLNPAKVSGAPPAKKTVNAPFNDPVRTLVALDAGTGKPLWTAEHPMLSGTLAVGGKSVVFVSRDRVQCLDRASGKPRWQSAAVPRLPVYPVRFTPTLVLYDDVVLFAGGELAGAPKRGNRSWDVDKNDTLTAMSTADGKVLWTAPHPHSGYASSEDVLVVDGVVWVGETTGGAAVGTFKGYDVRTGKVVKQFDPNVETYWFHHRCYRGKATENYLLISRTGTEFVDMKNEHWDIHHWVRGACLYGLMPANGLLYAPQHPCACFLESKQYGFNALAGKRPFRKAGPQLVKGPAFAKATAGKPAPGIPKSEDWPTFRGDNARRGLAATKLATELKPAWTAQVGGRLSPMTVAGGRIYVASIDDHTVHALSADTGEAAWQFTAGGRVDSPPTCFGGTVIFGSADGHVYCLNATDGKVVWRFRAAEGAAQVMSFGQLESAWPVHGSVLIEDDVLYFAAGRSIFLDGGLRLYRMDPRTGEVLSLTVLNERDEAADCNVQDYTRQLNMPAALPDILSCDGKQVYMRSQPFTLEGKRLPLEALGYTAQNPEQFGITVVQKPKHAHLFSATGFLDDSWWHRTYWVYGSHFFGGWSGYTRAGKVTPAGKILVMDDEQVYGFGRKLKFYRWTTPIEHMLFSASRDLTPVKAVKGSLAKGMKNPRVHKWTTDVPLFARAMLLSGDTLFLAGPSDIVNEEQLYRKWQDAQARKLIVKQAEMFAGTHGGVMWAVDKQTGERQAEWKLDTIPVFDGMAAADGRLYMACVNGRVMSFR